MPITAKNPHPLTSAAPTYNTSQTYKELHPAFGRLAIWRTDMTEQRLSYYLQAFERFCFDPGMKRSKEKRGKGKKLSSAPDYVPP